jgi:ceramide glucosyltransferase
MLTHQNNVAIESCVVGKSNMYSRANVNSLTTPSPTLRSQPDPPRGLAGFGPFMAEDNMIALSLWHELDLKHAMTGDVALDFLGPMSVRGYIDRRARWIRVRKMMTLPATLLEPLTESIVAGIYSAWALHRLTGIPGWLWWIINMGAWLTVDLDVRRNLAANVNTLWPQPSMPAFAAAWAARECLALPIWLYAMVGSAVMWRGNKYRILASGECCAVEESLVVAEGGKKPKSGKTLDEPGLEQGFNDSIQVPTPEPAKAKTATRRTARQRADATGEAKRID